SASFTRSVKGGSTMLRRVAALLLVLAVSRLGLAADKAAKKPLGTWSRESGDRKFTFDIKADTLTIKVTQGERKREATAAYGVTDEGLLFGVITRSDKKEGEGGPEKGDLFCFQFEVKGSELTLSDLKGTRVNEDARKHVEGVYTSDKK